MNSIVWIYVDGARSHPWCVLRRAIPGGRVATLCLAGDGYSGAVPYGPLLLTTEHPVGMACPACERHLAITMRGAAIAVEPSLVEDLAVSRESTADLRRPARVGRAAIGEWT